MTHYTQADLHMADRHIAKGETHITCQEALIMRLRTHSLPTEDANTLLELFDSTMVEHRAHRAAILAALKPTAGSRLSA